MAVSDLEDLFVDIGDADAMVNAVVGDMRMPAFVRWFVPWMAMDGAIDRGDRRRLETFLARGISAPWDPGRLERLKALADLIPDISDRRSELESSAARLIAGETLDDDGVRVLRLIIERLLQLGEFDLVSELIDTLDRAEFDTVVESSGASLRLELRRLMAEYQAEWPANEAMRSALLDGLGDGMPERPSILDDVADRDRIDHLSDEDQLAIRLYLAATRQYEPPSQLFWALLARGIQDFHEAEVAKQMFERAVAAPMADDALRGFVLMMSTACFDIDNPDDQARLELVMARLRQDFEQPLGRASAVVMSAILATRAGRETDLSAVDDAARELDADWIAASLRLVHASREGTAQLRRLLESMPTDTMIDPYMIPEILLSLRSAGMSSEAELVAEVAREQVLDDMLRSWSAVDGWAVRQVLDLCQALDEEGCFQTSWRDEMAEAFRANEISLRILLLDAELRGDWDTARDTAAAIAAERPKIYDIYWRLGRAEARLGNDAAAADALDIFVRYCGDSLYLREARELLAKLNEEGAD
jgi:hypothetical protein